MQSVTVSPQPTRQALEAKDRSLPGKVTGRIKRAIDAMVWQGARRDEAARIASLTDHSLRAALKKPHVKAYYLAECEVLRTSGRARRIHRLEAMVEQDDNKAAVINAALALDRIDAIEQSRTSQHQTPGFIIQVINAPSALMPSQAAIEPKPLKPIEADSYQADNGHAPLPHQGRGDG